MLGGQTDDERGQTIAVGRMTIDVTGRTVDVWLENVGNEQ